MAQKISKNKFIKGKKFRIKNIKIHRNHQLTQRFYYYSPKRKRKIVNLKNWIFKVKLISKEKACIIVKSFVNSIIM
jgi:hypothetical protein